VFRFCASLGTLFQETELPGRFAAAREQGFEAVELALPYDYPATELAAASAASGTEVVLFTAPLGNFMSGGEGLAAVPGEQAAFRDSVSVALEYAGALDARFVQFVAGRCSGGSGDAQKRSRYLATYVENLHHALEAFVGTGTRILVEAINTRDFPDFLLATPTQVREVTRQFPQGSLAEIFDSVHLALMGLDPVAEWREHGKRYAHVQLADAPDRSPPGSGTLDFPALLREIAESGYQGYLGAEYWETPETPDVHGWIGDAQSAWENRSSPAPS
jgi:hydroxypyruvate isomerase